MITGILLAYAISAILGALVTALRSFSLRPLRRKTGGAEEVLVFLVALAAGALWVLFVPVYVIGWLRSARAAAVAARIAGVAGRVRDKVLPKRHRLAH